jgi:hypothetical protein
MWTNENKSRNRTHFLCQYFFSLLPVKSRHTIKSRSNVLIVGGLFKYALTQRRANMPLAHHEKILQPV